MVRNREGAVERKAAGRFRFGKRAGRRCCISMLSSATRYRLRLGRPVTWSMCAAGRPSLILMTLEIVLCMFEVFVVRKWKRKS